MLLLLDVQTIMTEGCVRIFADNSPSDKCIRSSACVAIECIENNGRSEMHYVYG